MQVQSIQLKHTLHFSEITLNFNYHCLPVTLILGAQSSGKTTLIRFIYQALTWFPARYKDIRTAGVVMLDHDIMFGRLQSKIDITVRFPEDIEHLAESPHSQHTDPQLCSWQLYKTLNSHGVGSSKVETLQLEAMISRYQQAQQHDPTIGLPFIAFYPADRFLSEVNLLNKNNPIVLQSVNAYDLTALPFTTYARFFEWFREVTDLENAQTAIMVKKLLKQQQDSKESLFTTRLAHNYAQLSAPALQALQTALRTILPDFQTIYLDYQPKLQLMVQYQEKTLPFLQLSNSIKNLIGMVGDIVRRLCLLNPHRLFPCQEGEGILLIDAIDHQLDHNFASVILQRFNTAFPRLQIIASGSSDVLLENTENMQCLKLENKQIHHFPNMHIPLDQLYEQLNMDKSVSDCPSLDDLTQSHVEQLFNQIQNQLSPEQQQELLQRMQQEKNMNPQSNFQSN